MILGPEFKTLQLNKLNTRLKKIIYFKEFSYPAYFNTFLKHLYEVLNSDCKTRLVVFEPPGHRINLKRYNEMFFVAFENSKDMSAAENKDRLVVFKPCSLVLEKLCTGREDYDILIVYDKSGIDADMIAGSRVYKFNLVKGRSDLRLFNLIPLHSISSGLEDTALNLKEIENFKHINNESIRKKIYKKHFIDSFIKSLSDFEYSPKASGQEAYL